MRLLFEMDKKDHDACTHSFVRDSARSIIIRDGRPAMIHSMKFDYYKFPGGGIEDGEDPVDALLRETREEAGLVIMPGSVREYGYVHRVQKSDRDVTERFVQDNYYYLCEAERRSVSQELDDYEAGESYTLEYPDPAEAIRKNRSVTGSPYNRMMFEREARVLELLMEEGIVISGENDEHKERDSQQPLRSDG
ncbi:MAG: NUDIX domain-containing protein [Lachnospiraceae bacterium]|nr:NUDIX domain-containing protein [Lachnospiraceae bacterium]